MIYKIERYDIVNIQGYDDEGLNQTYDLYINTRNIVTIEPYFKFLESHSGYVDQLTEFGIIINSNLTPIERIAESYDDDPDENERCWKEKWNRICKICDEIVEIMKNEVTND